MLSFQAVLGYFLYTFCCITASNICKNLNAICVYNERIWDIFDLVVNENSSVNNSTLIHGPSIELNNVVSDFKLNPSIDVSSIPLENNPTDLVSDHSLTCNSEIETFSSFCPNKEPSSTERSSTERHVSLSTVKMNFLNRTRITSGARSFFAFSSKLLYFLATGRITANIQTESSSIPVPPTEPNIHYVVGEKYPSDAKHKYDFASSNAGARIVASSSAMQNVNTIQKSDLDSYMLIPCIQEAWYIVALNTQIFLKAIAISFHEAYSSTFQLVKIYGSNTYPTSNWQLIANLLPDMDRSSEYFPLTSACASLGSYSCWMRYMKVELYNTQPYGRYKYCTLTRFQVFGSDMLESLDSKLKKNLKPEEDCSKIEPEDIDLDTTYKKCNQVINPFELYSEDDNELFIEKSILNNELIIPFDLKNLYPKNQSFSDTNLDSSSVPSLLNLVDRIANLENLTSLIVNTTNHFLEKHNKVVRYEQIYLLNKYNTLYNAKSLYGKLLDELKAEKEKLKDRSVELLLLKILTYKSLCVGVSLKLPANDTPMVLMTKAELCAILNSELNKQKSSQSETIYEKRRLMRVQLYDQISKIQLQRPLLGKLIYSMYYLVSLLFITAIELIRKISRVFVHITSFLSRNFSINYRTQNQYLSTVLVYTTDAYTSVKSVLSILYKFLIFKILYYASYYIEKWIISLLAFGIYIFMEITVDRILLITLIYIIVQKIPFRRHFKRSSRAKRNTPLLSNQITERSFKPRKLEGFIRPTIQKYHRYKPIVKSHPAWQCVKQTADFKTSRMPFFDIQRETGHLLHQTLPENSETPLTSPTNVIANESISTINSDKANFEDAENSSINSGWVIVRKKK